MSGKDIGQNAGRVWRLVNERGEVTPTTIARELGLKGSEVDRAIGWLAREDKLCLTVNARGATRMTLK